jgi:hypothetical protein
VNTAAAMAIEMPVPAITSVRSPMRLVDERVERHHQ